MLTRISEYRGLHSEFENSAKYIPGEPNIELYIQMLKSAEYKPGGRNIELYIQMLNMVLNIDLQGRI